jgi:hypothetical protein
VSPLTACSVANTWSGTPGPLIAATSRARRVAGEHDPPLPLYEQAIIDYFESLLGAGLGGTAYVRS